MATTLRSLGIYSWRIGVTAALIWLTWAQLARSQRAEFVQLDVQRLNVVEADGKPRVIISSRTQMPNTYWKGKEYAHRSHGGGGFLFFNDDGSEAGGMGFASSSDGKGHYARSNLNFDQYQQDNTLQLVYVDDNGNRSAGVQVNDRPNESILPALEIIDRMNRTQDETERGALQAQLEQIAARYKEETAVRFFAGKQSGDSIVRLADSSGRPRLLLKVGAAGTASIEFLDETGAVVQRIPEVAAGK
jgi:hypothetical protein